MFLTWVAYTNSYAYNFDNQLTKVTRGSSTLGAYAYSPTSMRILSIEGGNTTAYVNMGVDVVYQNQTVAGVSISTDYVHVDGLLVARISGGSKYLRAENELGKH